MPSPFDSVRGYHQRTKHHFHRFAPGPGGMDWSNQPDPFRTFTGARQWELPLAADDAAASYPALYQPGRIAPRPFTRRALAALLELSFGLSAWKQYGGARWALRCNPSSGNLHPTEAYAVLQECEGVDNGVHHYLSRDHLLEHRCQWNSPDSGTPLLPAGAFLVGLSSIHWREAWKYGERAYRYCQHDAGHAIAALGYAAAALGWRAQLLSDWSDDDVATLLGLDRDTDFGAAEPEHADALLLVQTQPALPAPSDTASPEPLLRAAREGTWQGRANLLSPRHSHHWPIIEKVAEACAKPRTQTQPWRPPSLPQPPSSACEARAADIIRQRRSAQALDGVTPVPADVFYRMLDVTLPRADIVPFDAVPWQPRLHLLLFVHRVDGLAPGLYLLLRRDGLESELRAAMSSEFEWQPVENRPTHLLLFRLATGDVRNAAQALSCHQEIAADGAFSLAMLAEFDASLAQGPWQYRQLFWEAGMIGQVLYLEAEAAGVRGTGIGCYFDDGVHEMLGLQDQILQSMYHFTVGGTLSDTRLQTLPPYAHLHRT